jgi:hypothetical protein
LIKISKKITEVKDDASKLKDTDFEIKTSISDFDT